MAIERNEITEQEIQEAVQNNDVDFFIRFIVGNNVEDVKSNLIEEGVLIPSNPSTLDVYQTVKAYQADNGDFETGKILSVPYMDSGEAWTLGVRDYIANYGGPANVATGTNFGTAPDASAGDNSGSNIWGQIGNVLGNLGSGLIGGLLGGSGIGGSSQPAPAPPQEETTILGLEPEKFWLLLFGLIVVIAGIILISRRKSARI